MTGLAAVYHSRKMPALLPSSRCANVVYQLKIPYCFFNPQDLFPVSTTVSLSTFSLMPLNPV